MSDKFDSRIAEYLHGASLESWQDEEIGDVSELGWYGRFDGPMQPTDGHRETYGLTSEDVAELAHMGGAILFEDSQGFVYATTYTADKLADAWTTIVDDYSMFSA